jgi:hypothetical protein
VFLSRPVHRNRSAGDYDGHSRRTEGTRLGKKGHVISVTALVGKESKKLKDLRRAVDTSSGRQADKTVVLDFVSAIIDIRNLAAHFKSKLEQL